MNVHLWTNNGARGFLISSIVVIGLTFGMYCASLAQQQPPAVSPSAKTGSIPAPPAVPSQKAEPAEAPPAQAPPVAEPAPTAPQQAAAPAAAPAPVANAPASPAPQTGNAPAPPAAAAQTAAPAEAAPAQAPTVAEAAVPGTDKPESTASCPPEYLPLVQKTSAALLTSNFSFHPVKALDPFVPFLLPEPPPIQLLDEEDPAAKSDKPLTPLQLMTVAEIERGLKAITWGALGKKAVIEDATGKGFIVGEGTPAGERSGVIAQIDKDKLVIKQQVWDRTVKKHTPQDVIVKLKKKTDEQVERQAEELATEQSN